jgi:hypothetical protein
MDDWKRLEPDVVHWLSGFASESVEFRNSYQAIVGFPSDGFRSDGMVTDGKVLIAVEVEAGQTHPDTNTGKYWLLSAKHKEYEKAILFHVYTPDFNSYGWRQKLAEFYVEKMSSEVPIDYVLLDYRRTTEDYDTVFARVKALIGTRIKVELSIES